MKNEIGQPWDLSFTEYQGNNSYFETASLHVNETVADIRAIKYGTGKPFRISIVGDIKHDSD